MSTTMTEEDTSILDKIAPPSLKEFDAFPKLPSTYKARSESRGFLTVFVALLSFFMILNDLGEYIWGWPDYSFGVDTEWLERPFMTVNVDLVVNMPCQYLSVDLRDAIGDRLFLSEGFRRDGTFFDIGQAQTLQAHSQALSAQQAIAQSRKSRGFFSTLFGTYKPSFRPTYNFKADGNACRVFGSLEVKKVTANLHVTTLGHGYASATHVDHSLMNLSHVINEFSFGPYFPDITQPLDHTLEIAQEPFMAYQYFISVVPTTYISSSSSKLHTNQYSVTHYTRTLEHNRGTPGIFFKFDMEPLNLVIHQRTTTFLQFLIRVVGVVGGVWCCMGFAVRITYKAVEVATGADKTPGLVAAEATGVKKKWGGGSLRSRVTRQGNSWIVEGDSPYGSYATTPVSAGFVGTPPPASPYMSTPGGMNGGHASAGVNGGYGLGLSSPAFGPSTSGGHRRTSSSALAAASVPLPPTPRVNTGAGGTPYSPYTPSFASQSHSQSHSHAHAHHHHPPSSPYSPAAGHSHFPPTPNPANHAGPNGSGSTSSFANQQNSALKDGKKTD